MWVLKHTTFLNKNKTICANVRNISTFKPKRLLSRQFGKTIMKYSTETFVVNVTIIACFSRKLDAQKKHNMAELWSAPFRFTSEPIGRQNGKEILTFSICICKWCGCTTTSWICPRIYIFVSHFDEKASTLFLFSDNVWRRRKVRTYFFTWHFQRNSFNYRFKDSNVYYSEAVRNKCK